MIFLMLTFILKNLVPDQLVTSVPTKRGTSSLMSFDPGVFSFSKVAAWRWKHPEHITVLETRAVHAYLRRGPRGQRYFFLPDNAPSALAIAKGRSSSIRLNAVLRKLSVTTLSKNQQIFLAWTSTTLQSANYLTRSVFVEDMRRKFENDGEEEY